MFEDVQVLDAFCWSFQRITLELYDTWSIYAPCSLKTRVCNLLSSTDPPCFLLCFAVFSFGHVNWVLTVCGRNISIDKRKALVRHVHDNRGITGHCLKCNGLLSQMCIFLLLLLLLLLLVLVLLSFLTNTWMQLTSFSPTVSSCVLLYEVIICF